MSLGWEGGKTHRAACKVRRAGADRNDSSLWGGRVEAGGGGTGDGERRQGEDSVTARHLAYEGIVLRR